MRSPWLKGQLHVHTERSHDSTSPIGAVVSFYEGRGYDFIVLTDHNRITLAQSSKLLVGAGSELTQNSATCVPPPSAGGRCLIHTTAFFVDPSRDAHRGGRFRDPFHERRRAAFAFQIDRARELGGEAMLNHPFFHLAANAETVEFLARHHGLRFLEVVNAAHRGDWQPGEEDADRVNERLWDAVLTAGHDVWGVATDDSHHIATEERRRKTGKSVYGGDRAWITVRAARDLGAIRRAMLEGDFYASTGVVLTEIETSSERLRIRSSDASVTVRFLANAGREVGVGSGVSSEYVFRGDEGYVRAVVRAPHGAKAWTQPVRVPPARRPEQQP